MADVAGGPVTPVEGAPGDGGVQRGRPRPWRDGPVVFVVLVGSLIGLLLVFVVPAWAGGADESVHFARSLEIAHGRLEPAKDDAGLYVSRIPRSYRDEQLVVARGVAAHRTVLELSGEIIDGRPDWTDTEMFQTGTTMSSSIIGYLPASIAMVVPDRLGWSGVWALWFARLADLAVFIAVVGIAVRVARAFRWTLALSATVPIGLVLASSVGPDGLTIAACILGVAAWTRVWDPEGESGVIDRRTIAAVSAAAVLLAVVKPPYFVILVVVVVASWRRRRDRTARLSGLVAIAGLVLGASISLVGAGDQSGANIDTWAGPIVLQPDLQRERLLADPLGFLWRASTDWFTNLSSTASVWYRNFGFVRTSLPMVVVWGLLAVVVAAAVAGDHRSYLRLRGRDRLAFVAIAPFALLSIYVSRYLYADDSVDGIHMGLQVPRYTFPLLAVVLLGYVPRWAIGAVRSAVLVRTRGGSPKSTRGRDLSTVIPVLGALCVLVPVTAAVILFT